VDFYKIKERSPKKGTTEIYPDFTVNHSKDLMVRGKAFYAVWDEGLGLWSTDEYDCARLVDNDLFSYFDKVKGRTEDTISLKTLTDYSHNSWSQFKKFMTQVSDNSSQLDQKLTFSNTEVKKKDYVSRRLPYPLEVGNFDAYDEIIGTLYAPEEREKLEWAIGAIVAGDAKDIQKFIVLYGEAGSGKSTFLNILQKLFAGYYITFEAKALTAANNTFSTEVFRTNPLVAIQHDGDLSKIEDNTKLNSIISHEEMTMNEKYKASYTARSNSFLFMATNKPVKITDAKAGIIRRLIDVTPTGRKIPIARYFALMSQIDFELGAIAAHCLEVYRGLGKNYYSDYRPLDMMMQTDVFFNFVEDNYRTFKDQDGVSLAQAYSMYKTYCEEALVEFKLAKYKFREELKNYFKEFIIDTHIDGKHVHCYYAGFRSEKFKLAILSDSKPYSLEMSSSESLLDIALESCPAQYANEKGTPIARWSTVTTLLREIDTSKVHYVKPPNEHIVIDFDKNSLEENLEAASKWPPTYAEFSKGGVGIHLHYIYTGDVGKLSGMYAEGIEVKTFKGNSALRRRLSKCNNIPIATINSGLPLKGERMINFKVVESENALRDMVKRNLQKEFHPGTKPSIDFIHKILEDAYNNGLHYDLSDMFQEVLIFANNSTNQSEYCVNLVAEMKFKSEEPSLVEDIQNNEKIVFFDVEVFPNLLVVCWKYRGKRAKVVTMINPTPQEIEGLLKLDLFGFNCRRYDNHILYARFIGYDNYRLYLLSQKIINSINDHSGMFAEAYGASRADIYELSSEKKSLKKFEIDLGIPHKELGFKWDQPVPEDKWGLVAEYCGYDVLATEAVFEARSADWTARQILAELSGLSTNDTTQHHAAKIIFGDDPRPQEKFNYTDLSIEFPGYTFDRGKSLYRGEDPGEGGYVYAEPGMYANVADLDLLSGHPTTIEILDLFGPYTKNFSRLKAARIAIKHNDFKLAKEILGEKAAKYLTSEDQAQSLSYALKIIINIVYGLTSAKFDNKFRDIRNKDNIVAKRVALFMIDLKYAVQEKGFTVAHIKTDSIKIPNATPEIIAFINEFAAKYGYTFESEAIFEKLCLVNDAVYIAKVKDGDWIAVGAQFAHPYVFKKIFSREVIGFEDMCETKAVNTAMYLDMNENLGEEHDYRFVGKVGRFCPVAPGCGGGVLLREKEEKYYAVTGTKGYRWLEADVVKELKKTKDIDQSYYGELVDEAIKNISKFGDVDWFVSDDENLPWEGPERFVN
jgi:hypothetical protein